MLYKVFPMANYSEYERGTQMCLKKSYIKPSTGIAHRAVEVFKE